MHSLNTKTLKKIRPPSARDARCPGPIGVYSVEPLRNSTQLWLHLARALQTVFSFPPRAPWLLAGAHAVQEFKLLNASFSVSTAYACCFCLRTYCHRHLKLLSWPKTMSALLCEINMMASSVPLPELCPEATNFKKTATTSIAKCILIRPLPG